MSCCSSCLPTDSFCSPPKIFGRDLCMKPMKGSGDKVYIFVCLTVALYICHYQSAQSVYTRCLTGSLLCSEHRTITGTTCIFVGLQQYSQVRHVYPSDNRYDMCICRTTGSTYIFVSFPILLQCIVQHIYLLNYLILLGRFLSDLTYILLDYC